MKKRLLSAILSIVMLLTLLPVSAFAATAHDEEQKAEMDIPTFFDESPEGWEFIESDDNWDTGNFLYYGKIENGETTVYQKNRESNETTVFYSFEMLIETFFVDEESIYYLQDGNIYCFDVLSEIETCIWDNEDIISFYCNESGVICAYKNKDDDPTNISLQGQLLPERDFTDTVKLQNVYVEENALFPGKVLNVSQGAYGSFSHSDQNALDLIGNSSYFAAFSGSITAIKPDYNAVVLQSDNEVSYANGKSDYMSVLYMHDNDISDIEIGDHYDQGEYFYQPGVKGGATGDHVHLCVRTGKDKYLNHYGTGNIYAYEALFLQKSTQIVKGGGYTWQKLNYDAVTPFTPTPTTYTISYNANGGSGAPSAQTKVYDSTLTLSSAIPTRAGYTFLGWSTSSAATTATYTAGGSYTANASATLYAVWKASDGFCGGEGDGTNLSWTIDGDMVLVISGKGRMRNYENSSSVPWYDSRSEIKEIRLSNEATSIGDYVFTNCTSLTSITIPDSITAIGKYALAGCNGITSLTLPNNVTSIGAVAFFCCFSLTNITIPNSVKSIGDQAFYGCSSLTDVYFAGNVAQWNTLKESVGDRNDPLLNAAIHCTAIEPPTGVVAYAEGQTVKVSWNASQNATRYDVYLLQAPWGWNDIKYSQSTTYQYVEFWNVAPGDYCAFVIARPNSDSVQSEWKEITVIDPSTTYPITYNANGGSGAPSAQEKTYGVTLTLSSTTPMRAGYTFLGWSTSSTATTATYTAGGSYTANTSATLYAVWTPNTPGKPASVWLESSVIPDCGTLEVHWAATSNTDFYEVHISNSIERVRSNWGVYGLQASFSELPAGDYWVSVVAINKNLVGTGAVYYTASDLIPFTVENSSTYAPAKSIAYNGSEYLVFDNVLTWNDARLFCESRGGHLATIADADENAAIAVALQKGNDFAYWLGGTDAETEGTWKWVTGEAFGYTNWASGEPNDEEYFSINGEDYLGIYSNDELLGQWVDLPDTVRHGFIMEAELPEANVSGTVTLPEGYTASGDISGQVYVWTKNDGFNGELRIPAGETSASYSVVLPKGMMVSQINLDLYRMPDDCTLLDSYYYDGSKWKSGDYEPPAAFSLGNDLVLPDLTPEVGVTLSGTASLPEGVTYGDDLWYYIEYAYTFPGHDKAGGLYCRIEAGNHTGAWRLNVPQGSRITRLSVYLSDDDLTPEQQNLLSEIYYDGNGGYTTQFCKPDLIADGNLGGIDFPLQTGVTVSGTVTLPEGYAADEEISGAITLSGEKGSYVSFFMIPAGASGTEYSVTVPKGEQIREIILPLDRVSDRCPLFEYYFYDGSNWVTKYCELSEPLSVGDGLTLPDAVLRESVVISGTVMLPEGYAAEGDIRGQIIFDAGDSPYVSDFEISAGATRTDYSIAVPKGTEITTGRLYLYDLPDDCPLCTGYAYDGSAWRARWYCELPTPLSVGDGLTLPAVTLRKSRTITATVMLPDELYVENGTLGAQVYLFDGEKKLLFIGNGEEWEELQIYPCSDEERQMGHICTITVPDDDSEYRLLLNILTSSDDVRTNAETEPGYFWAGDNLPPTGFDQAALVKAGDNVTLTVPLKKTESGEISASAAAQRGENHVTITVRAESGMPEDGGMTFLAAIYDKNSGQMLAAGQVKSVSVPALNAADTSFTFAVGENRDVTWKVFVLDETYAPMKEAIIGECNAEAASNNAGLEGLAEIANNKVSELAEIANDGVSEMAMLMYTVGSGKYEEYEKWSTKLYDVYEVEAAKIYDVYTNSAM